MDFSEETLKVAHRHCSRHEAEVMQSSFCGCFYCQETYSPKEIDVWVDDAPRTAVCPRCGIDSVLGDASSFPVTDFAFLEAMHAYWFERTVTWTEGVKAIRRSRLKSGMRRLRDWLFGPGAEAR